MCVRTKERDGGKTEWLLLRPREEWWVFARENGSMSMYTYYTYYTRPYKWTEKERDRIRVVCLYIQQYTLYTCVRESKREREEGTIYTGYVLLPRVPGDFTR